MTTRNLPVLLGRAFLVFWFGAVTTPEAGAGQAQYSQTVGKSFCCGKPASGSIQVSGMPSNAYITSVSVSAWAPHQAPGTVEVWLGHQGYTPLRLVPFSSTMDDFDGQTPNGQWSLQVEDTFPELGMFNSNGYLLECVDPTVCCAGTLNSWQLTLNYSEHWVDLAAGSAPSTDPPTAGLGGASTLHLSVRNSGDMTANQFRVDYRLQSPDGTVACVGKNPIGSSTISSLAAGYSTQADFSCTIPTTAKGGPYQLCYQIDAGGSVSESNENNNSGCLPLTVIGPAVGTGLGALGAQNHVDSYFPNATNGTKYALYDVTRTAQYKTLPNHAHNGAMLAGNAIQTKDFSTNALVTDADNVWNAAEQKSAVDAQVNTGKTYDYLYSQLELNGYDHAGSSMTSVVNVSGPSYVNFEGDAMWRAPTVLFGKASTDRKAASGALDLVGHEWGHGVTEVYCGKLPRNASLEFQALTEAFSDWVGTATQAYDRGGHASGWPSTADWTMGEDTRPPPLRSLSSPGIDTYLSSAWSAAYEEKGTDKIYKLAGVPNKMFYLLTQGGTSPIGLRTAIKIALWANKYYWRSAGTLVEARDGMLEAASDLYPNSPTVTSVKKAWEAVGISDATLKGGTEAVQAGKCFLSILPFLFRGN